MKSIRLASVILIATTILQIAGGQDIRTVQTRVADLLAQLPAKNNQTLAESMDNMFSLGKEGLDLICSQVVPPGTGNDTQARFAIESLSRHLSGIGKDAEKVVWEEICLEWLDKSSEVAVKTFFISQLHYVGTDLSVEALSTLINQYDLAEQAVSAIVAIGSDRAVKALLTSLSGSGNRAVAATLNGLSALKSPTITPAILMLASSSDVEIRASAYRALSATGDVAAIETLTSAAENIDYMWDPSYTVTSLINLASNLGYAGNVKEMDRILKRVMVRCNKPGASQFRINALTVMVNHHGESAHKLLLEAMKEDDIVYRGAAMRLAGIIEGENYTSMWIKEVKGFSGQPKSEIVTMLGDREDKVAVPVLTSMLKDKETIVRQSAAFALAKIAGKDAIPALTQYLMDYEEADDQEAAATSLVTVLDKKSLKDLSAKLSYARPGPRSTIIGLLSWSKNQEYFNVVLAQTSSEDDGVRASSYIALKNLAPESSQTKLLELLVKAESKQEINEIKLALAAAARNNPDPEKRVGLLIGSLSDKAIREHIISVLAMLGGKTGVDAVLEEFKSGDARIRETCIEALIYWSDHNSLAALFEIIKSGDKTYSNAAFDSYLKQNARASITPEQKLLNIKNVAVFAIRPDQKILLVESAGSVKTYHSLFFVAKFLDDPDIASAASHMAMKIALPADGAASGMTGQMVKEILEKCIDSIAGEESGYNKERMRKYLAEMPSDDGFLPMFNGVDLAGWQGLVGNPITRSKMKPEELAAKQKTADEKARENWSVRDGMIWFTGTGDNLCSVKKYGDFELLLDWIITKNGDSGIYLRGSPQVQIWDTSRVDVGAQVGSGGLYNNQKNPSKPPLVADNKVGEWNTFRITMVGEIVSVWLNGVLVVDNVVLENYWDRSIPIFPVESIELQAHGTDLAFRDIYVRELSKPESGLTNQEKSEGFVALFNGKNLDGWVGDKISYVAEDGMIVIKPEKGSGGNLYTMNEYSDFVYRFEFQLTPGANNGLGVRAPLEGDAAYVGMELQILDNDAPVYANLQPYQYHGSVYGVIPAKRGYLKPPGEWNFQEVILEGTKIKITLNGTVIVDGDIAGARDNGTIDGNDHPGLRRTSGHIGFLGHGSVVKFRNIRVKELKPN